MSLVIICPERGARRWAAALESIVPDLKIEIWPDVSDTGAVEFALCWDQPPGVLKKFPNLRCISSLGAGVEHLMSDPTVPKGIPLVRVVDEDLKRSMAEYVLHGILDHFRRFGDYRRQQDECKWRMLKIGHTSELTVGIMGFGEMGRSAAQKLTDFGFTVRAWCRSPKPGGPVSVFAGRDELPEFLGKVDILVCLLPLTPDTESILNEQLFSYLPDGAYLINVGRGSHLVDSDLLPAIDSGRLSGALLDVFREEPLPEGHLFWAHDKITVTPHIASVTNPATVSLQIIENYRRARAGKPLFHQVNIERGY